MKKILTTIVLLMALGVLAYSALAMQNKTAALRAENQARVDAAQSELDKVIAEYAAIDPTTDEGMAHRIEAENRLITEAREQTETLSKENETLRRDNEELRQQVEALEAEEEKAYYLKTYESLHKGMEMVEGYIDGE